MSSDEVVFRPHATDLRLHTIEGITSPHFAQACTAVDHAARIAHVWEHMQEDFHLITRPLLRSILFPDRFPIPLSLYSIDDNTLPPPHYDDTEHLQHTEEQERAVLDALFPPLRISTPPCAEQPRQSIPRDHPGGDWLFNHPQAKHAHKMYVPHHGKAVKAKYVRYHRFGPYHEVDGVMGRGEEVHWTKLRLPSQRSGVPVMTLPQQRLFDSNLEARETIDRAIRDIDDWPLAAEVQFYRTTCDALDDCHKKVQELRRTIAQHMLDVKESVTRLLQAHAYDRLQKVLDREEDGVLWVANPELCTQLSEAYSAPDSIITTVCTWCQLTTHRVQDCSVFTQCKYCDNYGHFSDACHYPHRRCQTECRVSNTHPKYNKPCRTRPYAPPSDTSNERRRRVATREERVERRRIRRLGL
jgi:hypothetical protein